MDQKLATKLQAEMQREVSVIQDSQTKLQGLLGQRGKLIAQLNENEMVKKELDILDDSSIVYKLIGPVLVKQELTEAQLNVNNRLKFFNTELQRLEKQQKEYELNRTTAQTAIQKIQDTVRQAQQSAVAKQTQ